MFPKRAPFSPFPKRAKHLRECFAQTFEGQKIRTAHGAAPELIDGGVQAINPNAVVVLPDDETASGKTLVLALQNLRQRGAQTIHAVLVYNNLTLDPVARNLRGGCQWRPPSPRCSRPSAMRLCILCFPSDARLPLNIS